MFGAIFSKTTKGALLSNKIPSVLLVLFLIVFLGYVLITYLNQSDSKETEGQRQALLRERPLATGLRIDDYHGDEKCFTLLIESIEINRKKVGVFRLGFWKIAEFKNVHLSLFEYFDEDNPDRGHEQKQSVSSSDLELQGNPTGASSFGETIFDPKKMKLANFDGLKGIEIEGLKVTFYQNNNKISSLTGDLAKISAAKKTLTLKGAVRIEAVNGRSLQCHEICWDLTGRTFKTRGAYIAKTNGRVIQGQGLSTDFLLNHFKDTGGTHETS